jgi:hypothetical protein
MLVAGEGADGERRARWSRRKAAISDNASRIARQGAIAGLAASAVATVLAPVGVGFLVGKALLFVGAFALAIVLRLGVGSIALREAESRSRRVLLRWIPRICWLVCLWGWSWAVVPLANLVAVPTTIVANTFVVATYSSWTVSREVEGLGPHPLEWLVVGVALVALLALILATLFLGVLALWLGEVVASWWGSRA